LRACRPDAEARDHTVAGASLRVAQLQLGERAARHAAIDRRRGHRAVALLLATSARLGARSPRTPLAFDAVHRASVHVTSPLLGEQRAGLATKVCSCCHDTRATLSATSAGLGASTVSGPVRVHAVHGAGSSVASLRLRKVRAHRATVLVRRRDGARACLRAAAACLGAPGPHGERRSRAVHRAGAIAARLRFGQCPARMAAASNSC